MKSKIERNVLKEWWLTEKKVNECWEWWNEGMERCKMDVKIVMW